MHLEACAVWVDLGLLNNIMLQKVSQLDLDNNLARDLSKQILLPVIIGKADVWLLSASVCSFNDLLSEIASRLATFDLVPKEDHIPG